MTTSSLTEKQARNWALFAHLTSFLGYLIPFGNILAPLVIWLMKKNESDEFLVEKKSPLVMPPNYEELPRPKDFQLSEESKKDDEFKKVINNTKKITTKKTTKKSSLEKSIIEKIN